MTSQTEPTPREKASALLIVGLLGVVTTPALLPAGIAAIVVGLVLARQGFRWYAVAVVLPAVFVLTLTLVVTVR